MVLSWLRQRVQWAYLYRLRRSIEDPPSHIAVIQDGNRRFADKHGLDSSEGHAHGAETTEELLQWCDDLGVKEVTLYTFSTENFARPDAELTSLFDLITEKLHKLADADHIHENGVRIHALGDLTQLPQRVVDAVQDAEQQTVDYNQLKLNIALAYGGRNELLRATRQVMQDIEAGVLHPEDITTETIEEHLYREPLREVDLIIRTGGDERTSNFLPWYANGNEAAVYFCTPYWPEFDKVEFFRALRTYEARESSWQEAQTHRATALVRALTEIGYQNRPRVVERLQSQLTADKSPEFTKEADMEMLTKQSHHNLDSSGED